MKKLTSFRYRLARRDNRQASRTITQVPPLVRINCEMSLRHFRNCILSVSYPARTRTLRRAGGRIALSNDPSGARTGAVKGMIGAVETSLRRAGGGSICRAQTCAAMWFRSSETASTSSLWRTRYTRYRRSSHSTSWPSAGNPCSVSSTGSSCSPLPSSRMSTYPANMDGLQSMGGGWVGHRVIADLCQKLRAVSSADVSPRLAPGRTL